MHDGYESPDSDKNAFHGMDELLCEYVDGTMDPAVRRVFEEYMCANPELAEHVDDLRETRELLCRYRCRINAPFGFGSRLHREVTEDMMRAQAPILGNTSHRLRQATSLTSVVVAMMVVGLVSGSLLVDDKAAAPDRALQQSGSILNAAPSRAMDRLPVYSPSQSGFGGFSFAWPSSPIHASVVQAESHVEHSLLKDSTGLTLQVLP